MAPRVTPLEGVSTYALRGIRVRGVENPQGFGIDERRFVNLCLSLPDHIVSPYALCAACPHAPRLGEGRRGGGGKDEWAGGGEGVEGHN